MKNTLGQRLIPNNEKPILAGLYLSKFDSLGLRRLGFDSFTEAFNVLGYAVGAPPGSIKNYRDEFDPLFDNARKGWHKRPRRENCLRVLAGYEDLDLELFAGLIESFAGYDENAGSEVQPVEDSEQGGQFAKRLITGLAAEQYFEMVRQKLPEFQGHVAQNTTRLGCGYDFRLQRSPLEEFIAVEVKGLQGRQGSLSLTPKEYSVATNLKDRFFLFIVKNFQEAPFHEVFQNPLSSQLQFKRAERTIVQVSWLVNV